MPFVVQFPNIEKIGFPNLYGYVPNLAVNIVGCVLFGIILVAQLGIGAYTREWWMFVSWGITAGLELCGYVGRAVSNPCPYSDPMYKMQLVCLIIAPAFMAAGLYYQLAVEVTIYGEHFSILKPMIYTAIFTTGDVISLFVQAAGGGTAAAGVGTSSGPATGGWIMVGGIAFQVAVLSGFIVMFAITNYKIFKKSNRHLWNPDYEDVRNRKLFKFWLPSIWTSLLFLFIRSVYRIIELAEGWTGHLMRTERYFVILDGLMIVIGMAPLTIIHPGMAYGYIKVRGLHYKDKKVPTDDENMEHMNENSFGSTEPYTLGDDKPYEESFEKQDLDTTDSGEHGIK